jgi:hypothetical protein
MGLSGSVFLCRDLDRRHFFSVGTVFFRTGAVAECLPSILNISRLHEKKDVYTWIKKFYWI